MQVRRFDFPPGSARSVLARVRRVPRSRGFYGGVLFQATPTGKRRAQITNVLQLNASLLLDPPPGLRRLAFAAETVRAEPGSRRRLRVLVPVRNRGNFYGSAAGKLVVRDAAGVVVAGVVFQRRRILPGATVELPATVTKLLPAGSYRLSATVRGGPRPIGASGAMRLFGPNRLAVRAAKLVDVPAPTAYRGRALDLNAVYRNSGNVPYGPAGQIQVRPLVRGQRRPVALTTTMRVDRTSPGQRGRMRAEFKLPGSAPAYELTVRLLDGRRELDARTVAVTPTTRPGLPTRVKNFVTGHALALLGGLLALLVAGSIVGVGYVRRLKAKGVRPK